MPPVAEAEQTVSQVETGTSSGSRFAKIERLNISESGKRFTCNFIEPGLVSYKDTKEGGVDLVRKEAIDEALNSMIGSVLTIDHPPRHMIEAGNLTDVSHGRIDKVEYDPVSGWYTCSGTVETDQARQAIKDGGDASVGFSVEEWGPAGKWHGIPYSQEDTKIRFHHLAIVPANKRGRYEEAQIRLNAKQSMNPITKLIQKIVSGDKKTEVSKDITADTKFDLGEGKTATAEEMIAVFRDNAMHAIGDDTEFEHEGVRYNAKALIHHFKKHVMRLHEQKMVDEGTMKVLNDEADKAENKPMEHRMNDHTKAETMKKAESELMEQKKEECAERANAAPQEIEIAADNPYKLPAGKYVFTAAETTEQKAAKERENAAASEKAHIDAEIARRVKEEKEKMERENAKELGASSFRMLASAASTSSPAATSIPDYSLGSGSLEDGVNLGRSRYGKSVVNAGRQ